RFSERSGWQTSADGDGGGVGEASRQAQAAAREELRLRLSAPSRQGQTSGTRQQETPEKRGQKQERQGGDGGGDVHAPARRGRQAAWPGQQEVVRDVRRPEGGGVVGACGGDQTWLRAGHDEDGTNRHGR